jgi:predicted nucleic-acid-binding protein
VKIIADTNVLLRVVREDDPALTRIALKTLEEAEVVAISVHTLCELTWVLHRTCGVARADIADTIRRLAATRNVELDRPAVEAGLAMLDANGDFADGVIAHDGQWLGGETFVSFGKKAVGRLASLGLPAQLLQAP